MGLGVFFLILAGSPFVAFSQQQPLGLKGLPLQQQGPVNWPAGLSYDFELPSGKVVVIGDTHRKNPTSVMQKNPNKKIPLVLNRAAGEHDAVAVIHVGDVVQHGSLDKPVRGLTGWGAFREDAQALLGKGIPIFVAKGNHDYRGSASAAIGNFEKAFPHLKGKRFYSVKVGDTLFLVLDSNFKRLPKGVRQEQKVWFEEMLKRGQADKAVGNIVSVFHHAPYGATFLGMKDYAPGKAIQDFVKPAGAYSKARIFLSGHLHQYECRKINGNYFMVTGGASNSQWSRIWRPRSFVKRNRAAIFDFHYLRMTPAQYKTTSEGISRLVKGWAIEMVRFSKGLWKVGHRIVLH